MCKKWVLEIFARTLGTFEFPLPSTEQSLSYVSYTQNMQVLQMDSELGEG